MKSLSSRGRGERRAMLYEAEEGGNPENNLHSCYYFRFSCPLPYSLVLTNYDDRTCVYRTHPSFTHTFICIYNVCMYCILFLRMVGLGYECSVRVGRQ